MKESLNIEEMLPKWPGFIEFLSKLPEDKRAYVIAYIEEHQILGNPILEEMFLQNYASAMTFKNYLEVKESLGKDLEAKLEGVTMEWFSALQSFIDEQAGHLAGASNVLSERLEKLVEAFDAVKEEAERDQESRAEAMRTEIAGELQQIAAVRDEFSAQVLVERKKIQDVTLKMLSDNMKVVLKSELEAAKQGGNAGKFGLKMIVRDVGVLLVALGIFQVLQKLI